METQRFVQQNTATSTQSPSVGWRPADAPVGKTRSIEGRSEVRVDPAQNRIRAPRSRAEQLAKFVAQFQANTARHPGNVGAELAGQTPMTNRVAPAARKGLATEDQQKVEEAIQAIDRGRRQFSASAAMSRTPVSSIQSVKTPYPTSTQAGIVSTVSEAIASEVSQPAPAEQPRVAPVAAIRQPFFAHSAGAPTARPEVVFGDARTAPANRVEAPAAPAPNAYGEGLGSRSGIPSRMGNCSEEPKPNDQFGDARNAGNGCRRFTRIIVA